MINIHGDVDPYGEENWNDNYVESCGVTCNATYWMSDTTGSSGTKGTKNFVIINRFIGKKHRKKNYDFHKIKKLK